MPIGRSLISKLLYVDRGSLLQKAFTSHDQRLYSWLISCKIVVAHNSFASYASIGKTYNGLHIGQVNVSSGGVTAKAIIFIECGIHATEQSLDISFNNSQLASGHGSDPKMTSLSDKYDCDPIIFIT